MIDKARRNLPEFFEKLMGLQCFSGAEIHSTSDGFYVAVTAISDLLVRCGIDTVPDSRGEPMECRLFFDDWYLYAVEDQGSYTYSLFKMREQEYDAKLGRKADGDVPGVTISFIALETDILWDCLCDPTEHNRRRLNREIDRVVAAGGQKHCEALKRYFIRTEAQGAYLVAKLYTGYIASLAQNGELPVPERYASDYRKQGARGRVPRFIEENNRYAESMICDHKRI